MFLRIEIFFTGDKLCQHSIKDEEHEQQVDAHENTHLYQCGDASLDLPLC